MKTENFKLSRWPQHGVDETSSRIAGEWDVRRLKCFHSMPSYVVKTGSKTVFIGRSSIKK